MIARGWSIRDYWVSKPAKGQCQLVAHGRRKTRWLVPVESKLTPGRLLVGDLDKVVGCVMRNALPKLK